MLAIHGVNINLEVHFYVLFWWNTNISQVVHSKFQDLVPKQFDEDDESLEIPNEDSVQETTEKTRLALERLVSAKTSAALPVRAAEKQAPAQYIRFVFTNSGISQIFLNYKANLVHHLRRCHKSHNPMFQICVGWNQWRHVNKLILDSILSTSRSRNKLQWV